MCAGKTQRPSVHGHRTKGILCVPPSSHRPVRRLLLTGLVLSLPAALHAQRLDPGFGAEGRVVYGVPDTLPAYLPVAALVPLPDGQFLSVGSGAMMRFSADGRRDRTFGQNGLSRDTRIRGPLYDARLDASGRVVAAGEEVLASVEFCGDDIESDFAVARFFADGRTDSTFGRERAVRIDFPRPLTFVDAAPAVASTANGTAGACGTTGAEMTHDTALRLAVGAGGAVTLAGRTSTLRGRSYGALARLDGTGHLDPTFGMGGRVVLPDSFPRALGGLAALPGGGYMASGPLPWVGIGFVRLHGDGRLDASFGRRGLAIVPVAGFDQDPAIASAFVPLPDGGAAEAGVLGGEIVVARVNAQGQPEARFGTGGVVRIPVSGSARVTALGTDSFGRFFMTGEIDGTASFLRLSPGGTVEIARALDTQSRLSVATALLVRPDGRLVVAGVRVPGAPPAHDTFVAIVNADGATEHLEIVQETTLEAREERAGSLTAVDGDAVLVGGTRNGSAFLLRLSEGGAAERFTNPLVPASQPGGAWELPTLDALDDGHMLGVGIWQGSLRRLLVTNAGTLVSSGPLGATATAPEGAQPSGGRGRSARRPGGGVVVAGTVQNGDGSNSLVVVWLDAAGQPDERFGPGGARRYDLRATGSTVPPGDPDTPVSLAVDGSGRVLIGGILGGVAGILRLTSDGAIDAGFGVGGVTRGVTGRVALIADDAGAVFALDRHDGVDSGDSGVRVTHYDANGRITGSTVVKPPTGAFVPANARRLRSGSILVGGALYTSTGGPDAALLRLLPDGSADAAFGIGGVYATGQVGAVDALAEDARGRLLVAINIPGDVVLLRLLPPTTTDAEPSDGDAAGLSLNAPSPNPVRGPVAFRFSLDRPKAVRLAVYDILGREVAIVREGIHQAGTHEVSFDAGVLPSGVYIVRLTANGQALTRSFMRTR